MHILTTTYTALLHLDLSTTRFITQFLDREALETFSLVCQHWYFASRPTIFQKLIIGDQDKYQKLIKLLSQCSDVYPWIKTLCIKRSQHEDAPTLDSYIYAFASELVPKLSRLERLELAWFEELPPENIPLFLQAFSSLETVHTLCFMNCSFSHHVFLTLIHSFPSVTSLHLAGNVPHSTTIPLPFTQSGSHALQLQRLRYHETEDRTCGKDSREAFIEVLYQAIVSSNSKNYLRSLDVSFSSQLSLKYVGMLLKTVCDSLEDLKIKLPMSLKSWGKDRGCTGQSRLFDIEPSANLRYG